MKSGEKVMKGTDFDGEDGIGSNVVEEQVLQATLG